MESKKRGGFNDNRDLFEPTSGDKNGRKKHKKTIRLIVFTLSLKRYPVRYHGNFYYYFYMHLSFSTFLQSSFSALFIIEGSKIVGDPFAVH